MASSFGGNALSSGECVETASLDTALDTRGSPEGETRLFDEANCLEEGKIKLVELIGIEPTTSGLQSPRSPS